MDGTAHDAAAISEFERGHRAGTVDQTLREHDDHLRTVNGSIERTAVRLEHLALEVRALAEEGRLREERAVAAAEALAGMNARRRTDMIDEYRLQDREAAAADRRWTKRERLLGLGIACVATGVGVTSTLVALHPFG